MTYSKPEVTCMSAVKAIQSGQTKPSLIVQDAQGSSQPKVTSAAYEADE